MTEVWKHMSAILVFSAFILLMLVPFVPSAQSLPWAVSINPKDISDVDINAGETAVISITGPEGAEFYVEVISSNETAESVFRFPETGLSGLPSGIALVVWDISPTVVLGLYYLQLKDGGESVRSIVSFQIQEFAGDVIPPPPTVEERLSDLENQVIRQKFENDRLLERLDRILRQLDRDKALLMAISSLAIGMAIVGFVSAFSGRFDTMRKIFWGEKEQGEDEATKKMEELLQFFVARELPAELGGVMLKRDVSVEIPIESPVPVKTRTPVSYEESPEEQDEPEIPEDFRPRRKGGMYTKVCQYCGDEFKTKTARAKYCPAPRNCRVLAFRQRKKEEGKSE